MSSQFDAEVLIIGAGMSGLGLAVQIIRKFGVKNFELIEKGEDVGGTWLANTYPGCGCDVVSHFYSYSFALNPDWSRKYALRPEIQQYFRDVAEKYRIVEHVKFHSVVERADWDDVDKVWLVKVKDLKTKETRVRRAKVLVSGVGALSVPKKCDIPGVDKFEGRIFHSAQWDHSFDWNNKEVVVLGNGCSATQFIPVMASEPKPVKKITQFSRQAQFIAERKNPYYSSTFKFTMRYVPLAMRIYRAHHYYLMERDWSGFPIDEGRAIRDGLKKENEAYVKRMAPRKYWDALIPKTEVGCKRKVLDTEYLQVLNNDNVELVWDDPVNEIVRDGVRTKSGREVKADAIALATGFATQQMLFPMELNGRDGLSLNKYWHDNTRSVAQAYFGTCIPEFPNFFIMMGPNTTTGHLSVIYTVECQINFTLRLLTPVIKSLPSYQSRSFMPSALLPAPTTVEVKHEAAISDYQWTQRELKRMVWASGCTTWAVDPETGLNNMMYPDWQFLYWFRSIFWKKTDFMYLDEKTGMEVKPVAWTRTFASVLAVAALTTAGLVGLGVTDRDEVMRYLSRFDPRDLIAST